MPKQVIIPPGTTAPIAPFVPGTLADGVVYVSGTLPFDKQNNVVHIGDPKAQTRHVLETIRSVIETAGGSMADVTFNSIFITDWTNYAAINEVYAEFFPGDKPARFCIQCGLVKPDALVEIASVAHIGTRHDEAQYCSGSVARRAGGGPQRRSGRGRRLLAGAARGAGGTVSAGEL